jgi:hypothetical protein
MILVQSDVRYLHIDAQHFKVSWKLTQKGLHFFVGVNEITCVCLRTVEGYYDILKENSALVLSAKFTA